MLRIINFKKIFLVAAFGVFFVLIASLSPLQAGMISPKLQSALAAASPNSKIPIIVTLSNRFEIKPFAKKRRKKDRASLIRALKKRFADNLTRGDLSASIQSLGDGLRGNGRTRHLWLINGIALKAKPSVIRRLAKKAAVESIRMDAVISLPAMPAEIAGTAEWNLTAIGAPTLWNAGYTGQGIVVANMDSGVDVEHPDLQGRWRGGNNSWFDANDPDFDPYINNRPYDPDGHGTAVMGIMVGGNAGGTAVGIAPGAQWIAVKIFDAITGEALESEIHAGFQWLLDPDGDPDTDDAPDVVNNSWGFQQEDVCYEGSGQTSFLTDIRTLKQAGIAVVFSAGNYGPYPNSSVSPANYPESFAVGSIDENSVISDFSSRGPSACNGGTYPDVVAPGERNSFPYGIKTTDLYMGQPNPYAYVAGTSIAAPHAAGAMALLLSAFPDSTPEQLESGLKASAVDLPPDGPDNVTGHGLIDAVKAYLFLGGSDAIFVKDVIYDSVAQTLTVIATSNRQPEVRLSAQNFGNLEWKSWLNFYRNTFSGVATRPASVTVTSSGGGFDTYVFPDPDDVAIENVFYSPEEGGTLTVIATSSQQPDVQLQAEGLGPLAWKSWLNFYRNTFYGVASRPSVVTVTSSGGDSETFQFPDPDTVAVENVFYSPDSGGTLTVIATSSDQPDVQLAVEGFGPLKWKSWLNFYRNTFTGVGERPESVTVYSSGGGLDAFP